MLVLGGGPPARGASDHDADSYRQFAARLEEIGRYSHSLGVRAVYHPHIDTFIETRAQLDRFMDILNTDYVGLCVDPAHFQIMDSDPIDIFRTYISAIGYVHLKDCKGNVGPNDGYNRYLAFCELGAGVIDIPAIVDTLIDNSYDGLVVIELDYSESPNESCKRSVAYVTERLGLVLQPA